MKIYRQISFTEIIERSTSHTKMTVKHYFFGVKVWEEIFENYRIN